MGLDREQSAQTLINYFLFYNKSGSTYDENEANRLTDDVLNDLNRKINDIFFFLMYIMCSAHFTRGHTCSLLIVIKTEMFYKQVKCS